MESSNQNYSHLHSIIPSSSSSSSSTSISISPPTIQQPPPPPTSSGEDSASQVARQLLSELGINVHMATDAMEMDQLVQQVLTISNTYPSSFRSFVSLLQNLINFGASISEIISIVNEDDSLRILPPPPSSTTFDSTLDKIVPMDNPNVQTLHENISLEQIHSSKVDSNYICSRKRQVSAQETYTTFNKRARKKSFLPRDERPLIIELSDDEHENNEDVIDNSKKLRDLESELAKMNEKIAELERIRMENAEGEESDGVIVGGGGGLLGQSLSLNDGMIEEGTNSIFATPSLTFLGESIKDSSLSNDEQDLVLRDDIHGNAETDALEENIRMKRIEINDMEQKISANMNEMSKLRAMLKSLEREAQIMIKEKASLFEQLSNMQKEMRKTLTFEKSFTRSNSVPLTSSFPSRKRQPLKILKAIQGKKQSFNNSNSNSRKEALEKLLRAVESNIEMHKKILEAESKGSIPREIVEERTCLVHDMIQILSSGALQDYINRKRKQENSQTFKTTSNTYFKKVIDLNGNLSKNTVTKNASDMKDVLSRPYVSILSCFKSFKFSRFCTVPPTSLTFTNLINPYIMLCKFEMMGGICDDLKCNGQHFSGIVLTDGQLVTDLMKHLLGTFVPPWHLSTRINVAKDALIGILSNHIEDSSDELLGKLKDIYLSGACIDLERGKGHFVAGRLPSTLDCASVSSSSCSDSIADGSDMDLGD